MSRRRPLLDRRSGHLLPALAAASLALPAAAGCSPGPGDRSGPAGSASEAVEVVPAVTVPEGIHRQVPGGPTIGGRPVTPAERRLTRPANVDVEVVATGLEAPWDLDWTPDGRLFVTERPGRVRLIEGGRLRGAPWIVFPEVAASGEGGLMSMAVHPRFAAEPWLYFAMTARRPNGEIENRVVRVRDEGGQPGSQEIILAGLPAGQAHDGTGLAFGPDGKLYVSTGEVWQKEIAQDLANKGGKVLRLEPDGSIPADNPFGSDSPVYSLGHRNPQGLAFDPRTGYLWSTEHGPSGEWPGVGGHDELNRIEAGRNYGWPLVIGAPGRPEFADPVLVFPVHKLPPAGIAVYSGRRIPEWNGNLFFASLLGQTLVRVALDEATRTRPQAIQRLYEIDFLAGVYGRLRAVGEGPDGYLYFGTSNRDGRGRPRRGDDRIFRIVPRAR